MAADIYTDKHGTPMARLQRGDGYYVPKGGYAWRGWDIMRQPEGWGAVTHMSRPVVGRPGSGMKGLPEPVYAATLTELRAVLVATAKKV